MSDLVLSMDDLARVSEMFARSQYFMDAKEAAQVGVKILAGRELGFGPFASVNGVHIIKGKPAVGANLMAAAVKAHAKYDYRVRRMDNEECQIEFFQAGESIGVSTFTLDDARAAGTQNLQKFARNMLFARAMSNGVRWFCPDVFTGSAVYTPEELGATVDGEGDVIDVTPVEAPEPAPAPTEPTPAVKAPSRPSQGLSKDAAQRLHVALTKLGVKDQFEVATSVTGREITTFLDLTVEEAKAVHARANGGM